MRIPFDSMMLRDQHHDAMRTTVALDEDVASTWSDTLRAGLALESRAKKLAPFNVDRRHLVRLKPGFVTARSRRSPTSSTDPAAYNSVAPEHERA